MPLSEYAFGGIMSKWTIKQTEEFAEWFESSDSKPQEDILEKVQTLSELGPHLGRPLVDTLKGSSISNLKELRFDSNGKVMRITFVFDPDRNGVLLIGGDKAGKNQVKFYQELIANSEEIYKKWLDSRTKAIEAQRKKIAKKVVQKPLVKPKKGKIK